MRRNKGIARQHAAGEYIARCAESSHDTASRRCLRYAVSHRSRAGSPPTDLRVPPTTRSPLSSRMRPCMPRSPPVRSRGLLPRHRARRDQLFSGPDAQVRGAPGVKSRPHPVHPHSPAGPRLVEWLASGPADQPALRQHAHHLRLPLVQPSAPSGCFRRVAACSSDGAA